MSVFPLPVQNRSLAESFTISFVRVSFLLELDTPWRAVKSCSVCVIATNLLHCVAKGNRCAIWPEKFPGLVRGRCCLEVLVVTPQLALSGKKRWPVDFEGILSILFCGYHEFVEESISGLLLWVRRPDSFALRTSWIRSINFCFSS